MVEAEAILGRNKNIIKIGTRNMANSAMFGGLVVDENGEAAKVKYVGERACYVVDDDGFVRHIDAEEVDRQVLRFMSGEVEEHRGEAVSQMMQMMDKDDIFTKAAIESTINNMEDNVGQPIPEQARQWLGMLGFRIVIDYDGTVTDIQMPEMPEGGFPGLGGM